MRISTQAPPRGIALIIVMIVIIVLGILAGGFAYSMKVETTLARNANFERDLEWLGGSGVELARYVLAQQMMSPNESYDWLSHKWAGGPGSMYSVTHEALAPISLEKNELGKGHFSIKIVDMERRVNLNTVDQPMLQQALSMVGVDPTTASTVVDSILDWREPDTNPRITGAKSDYYLKLEPPYYCKCGPIEDVSELLLIRGVTPEIYWGPNNSTATSYVEARARPTAVLGLGQPSLQVG